MVRREEAGGGAETLRGGGRGSRRKRRPGLRPQEGRRRLRRPSPDFLKLCDQEIIIPIQVPPRFKGLILFVHKVVPAVFKV